MFLFAGGDMGVRAVSGHRRWLLVQYLSHARGVNLRAGSNESVRFVYAFTHFLVAFGHHIQPPEVHIQYISMHYKFSLHSNSRIFPRSFPISRCFVSTPKAPAEVESKFNIPHILPLGRSFGPSRKTGRLHTAVKFGNTDASFFENPQRVRSWFRDISILTSLSRRLRYASPATPFDTAKVVEASGAYFIP